MARSTSISQTALDTESVTFGEGVQNVQYYGRGATVEGLSNEGVAALASGFTDVSTAALESQSKTAESGFGTIEKVVRNLQSGAESSLKAIDQAYSKSVSGTASLESLKPFIIGALALGSIAILSASMKK